MREQLSSERIEGGVRRRERNTSVDEFETEIRVERAIGEDPATPIMLIERYAGDTSARSLMFLSATEARAIAADLLAAAAQIDPEISVEGGLA